MLHIYRPICSLQFLVIETCTLQPRVHCLGGGTHATSANEPLHICDLCKKQSISLAVCNCKTHRLCTWYGQSADTLSETKSQRTWQHNKRISSAVFLRSQRNSNRIRTTKRQGYLGSHSPQKKILFSHVNFFIKKEHMETSKNVVALQKDFMIWSLCFEYRMFN